MTEYYPRDFIGYGRTPPNPKWPLDAYIAVQFVLNYEEGGERCILHQDEESESFLSEIIGAEPWNGQRHMNMESMYEYGSRSGFWRIWRLFNKYNIPVTVYGVASALQRNPEAVEAMLESHWEIASHGLKWIEYRNFSYEQEREHMQEAIAIHTKVTGTRPLGWYTGRSSVHTLELVAEEGGFAYASDSYSDDLPYWLKSKHKKQLIIPYTLDANDMRFATAQGFNHGGDYFNYLKDSFDVLYEEGKQGQPKMLSIGLHCRLIGRPGRIKALENFIKYIQNHSYVWLAKRIDIAHHWQKHYTM